MNEQYQHNKNTQKTSFNFYTPFLYAIIMVIGMQLGLKMYETLKSKPKLFSSSNKISELQEVFSYIDARYVDEVESKDLVEKAIRETLEELDPHSSYISAEELQAVNEGLQGNFEGIGVEFSIVKDTIMVVTPIAGGPSDKLGIMSGDKIIQIEDTLVAGIGITSEDVVGKLRGEKGSSVKVSIARSGVANLLDFNIHRDKIPLYSVDVNYMIDEEVGYIKVSRFSATTYHEFMDALSNLKDEGMRRLILDLRQNPGGYLTAAVNIADEFLADNKLMVYTKGRSHKQTDYRAKRRGQFEEGDLLVLIDSGSASASEIVSGAIQDWDRGILMGRRSFGKGLVQEQRELSNGGALRLTVARYYTPTGRCIQKPYEEGEEAYNKELSERFNKGQLQQEDSMRHAHNDSLTFKTLIKERTVYGGGGIMPDIFVPIDSSGNEPFLIKVRSIIPEFAYSYFSNHTAEFKQYPNINDFKKRFHITAQMFNQFKSEIKKQTDKFDESLFQRDEQELKTYLKAYIARQLWNDDGFYPVIQDVDNTLKEAIKEIKKG